MRKSPTNKRVLKHPSLVVADKVLREINKIGVPDYLSCDVLTFDNGREQGYKIRCRDTRFATSDFLYAAFAESRGSDEIVCYVTFNEQIFNEDGVEPLWSATFSQGDYKKAAEFITDAIGRYQAEAK